jgi:putative Mn2+ efflux pump MntP
MSFFEILLIAIGLALDAFAVTLGATGSGQAKGHGAAFRFSFHFGLFQGLMPIAGWYAGRSVIHWVKSFDHWIAFALLLFVGARMIASSFDQRAEIIRFDPSRGASLVMLSVATSIDALAVGISLAMVDFAIWVPSLIIALVTSALCAAAYPLGTRLGMRLAKRMSFAGGLILFFIGARILVTHLLA